MNVVIISSDFRKCYFISFFDFGTDFFDFGINSCRKDGSPIFCQANDVIHQDRNIVLFMNKLAH